MSGAGHELFTYPGRSWAVEKVLESWRTQEITACVPVATLCVGLGLWLRVAPGWGLKSVSIVYLGSFWTNDHLCFVLCSVFAAASVAGPGSSPPWDLCGYWPLLLVLLTCQSPLSAMVTCRV